MYIHVKPEDSGKAVAAVGSLLYFQEVCHPRTHNNCMGPMINGVEGTLTRREYITSQVASVTPAHNV